MAERIIGVDFGTSTSVIRVKRYENGTPIGEKLETKEVVFGGNGAMVPTLIMKKDDDPSVAYYGYEAQQKKRRFTTFQSFKVDLESANGEKRAQARELTEEFFAYLGKQYRTQSDGGHLGNPDDKEHTIISYPVKWSEETKRFMLEAAKKAGFPNVTGMDEAQAAIQAVTVMSTDHLKKNGLLVNGKPANILLIDMGAGTTDLVLCRYTPGAEEPPKILSTWPKSGKLFFGGKEIDALLKNFFWDKMDEEDARQVFQRIGTDKFKSWKENTVSPALWKKDSVSDFEVLDSCVEMMGIDMDEYCLNRAAFEECLKGYLKQFPILINGCIQDAGVNGSDVDLVIVTGGHSQWYFVQEMLSGKMEQFGKIDLPKIRENPVRIIPISRPQETVALGLVYGNLRLNAEEEKAINARLLAEQERKEKERRQREEAQRLEEQRREEELQRQRALNRQEQARRQTAARTENKTVNELYTPESEFELGSIGEDYFIRRYIGKRSVVSIPPVIRGRKVVEIGEFAFGYRSYITGLNSTVETVIIPESVRKIGKHAFQWCHKLSKVVIPKTVHEIDNNVFMGCKKLAVVIAHPNVERIGTSAFLDCNSLQMIDFGMGNSAPGSVWFPPSLKEIGAGAFAKENGLKFVCVFTEINISKKTKVKSIIGFPQNFDPKYCAVFYYD